LRGPGENPAAAVLARAARVVATVVGGRSADDALAASGEGSRLAAVRAIALGTVRWYLRLEPAIDSLLERPRGLAPEIHALLLAAAHQMEYSRVAPELTVHTAVDAARALRQPRAAALVNAVLRRLLAGRQALFARLDAELATRTAHPRWLVEKLSQAWPERLGTILEANNLHPPMVLRLNPRRRSAKQYLADLAGAGIAASLVEWGERARPHGVPWPVGVRLERPVPVAGLPGFSEGWVSVQDAAAQLAAPLVDAAPGMRVLDACAAPGGKAAHLLESAPGPIELTAIDIDARRLERLEESLARLGLPASCRAADIRDPQSFWDGKPFERVLVDAPCSGTGVIRRHPDIKLLRRPTDIPVLARNQLAILEAAFGLLAPGGRLVYCTCSALPEENEGVVARFLERQRQARPASAPAGEALAPGALERNPGTQLLCGGAAGTDGFYYACIEKTTTGT
jgi:16S rRNA (cytosine967-C5)-methyltransferase